MLILLVSCKFWKKGLREETTIGKALPKLNLESIKKIPMAGFWLIHVMFRSFLMQISLLKLHEAWKEFKKKEKKNNNLMGFLIHHKESTPFNRAIIVQVVPKIL